MLSCEYLIDLPSFFSGQIAEGLDVDLVANTPLLMARHLVELTEPQKHGGHVDRLLAFSERMPD